MDKSGVIHIGLLGFGTVGEGVYNMLEANARSIARRTGRCVEISRIAIREKTKPRSVARPIFTEDGLSVATDPTIDLVVEVIGGVSPAREWIEAAIKAGKSVITANKELIAKHGHELQKLAQHHKVELHFEAAVGGGIPLIQPLRHQLAGNDMDQLMGILNGTTNVILTRMSSGQCSFEEALKEAQDKGYAEADPTNDVDGWDTLYKTCILASVIYGRPVDITKAHREGIREVQQRDLQFASVLGYKLKLLGVIDDVGPGRARVRVHPAMVKDTHPLAAVNDVFNAMWFRGDFVGDVLLSGRGAGAHPTASAVIGDIIDVARGSSGLGSADPGTNDESLELAEMSSLVSSYYIRLNVLDKPNTLGIISTVFGQHGVGLAEMEMRVVGKELGEIVFLTHDCPERQFLNAMWEVEALEVVHELGSWMRVVKL